jgi:hypothetical protein
MDISMSLIDHIKNIAHDISENYIIYKKDLNESILEVYYNGGIDNFEILKRICELVNQNVYLAIYNDSSADKTNIQFPLADFEYLKNEIQQSEKNMNDYEMPPEDFHNNVMTIINDNDISLESIPESKYSYLNDFTKLSQYNNSIDKFVNTLQCIKSQEIRNSKEELLKIAKQTKSMVFNKESIGDIAKLSSRYLKSEGFDIDKIAAVYNLIHKDLIKDGFIVSTEFTKVSSLTINKNSEILKPVKEFMLCIEKAAACQEMIDNIFKLNQSIKKVINEEIVKK